MAPHAPRRSGPRHALVLRIGSTRVAVPSPGGQALLKRRKPAIRGSAASIVIDAPRIALRFSGFFDADDAAKTPSANTKSLTNGSQNHSHPENPNAHILFPAPRAIRRGGSRPISPMHHNCAEGSILR